MRRKDTNFQDGTLPQLEVLHYHFRVRNLLQLNFRRESRQSLTWVDVTTGEREKFLFTTEICFCDAVVRAVVVKVVVGVVSVAAWKDESLEQYKQLLRQE